MAKDIKLDNYFDLLIENGDFVIDETEMQEVGIILALTQGELKSDPLIGANLTKFIRGSKVKNLVERQIRIQMELDDKDYDEIKNRIQYD